MSDRDASSGSGTGPDHGEGNGAPSSVEEQIGSLLDAYLAALEAGESPDPGQLLAEHPDLAGWLRDGLEVLHLADAVADRPGGADRLRSTLSMNAGVLESVWRGDGLPPHLLLTEPPGQEPPPVRTRTDALPDATVAAGRYRLLGELARGGMGAILRARDEDLGRDLAVKVLLDRHRDDPGILRRFIEEAQIGGQLQHPGIVPVYDLGSFADRRPFFAMKLVQGRTLARPAGRSARARGRADAVPRHLRAGLPDRRLRPRPPGDPPRPEALERHGRQLRRGPGDGLGPRQGPGRRRRRRRAATGRRRRGGRRPGIRTIRTAAGAPTRRPAASWGRRPTWPPSRHVVRSTGSTSGPTSSASGRSSARS